MDKFRKMRESEIVRSDDRTSALERYASFIEDRHGLTVESARAKKVSKDIAAYNESDKEDLPVIFSYAKGINLRDLDASEARIKSAQIKEASVMDEIEAMIKEASKCEHSEDCEGCDECKVTEEKLENERKGEDETPVKESTTELKKRLLKEAARRGIFKLGV
jgi:hypothetical protein